MNKGELISRVADDAGVSKAQATAAVDSVFDAIQRSLKKGDKASFVGFGTFSTTDRKARDGRNPATGATIKIPAKTVVKFKPGKALTESVK